MKVSNRRQRVTLQYHGLERRDDRLSDEKPQNLDETCRFDLARRVPAALRNMHTAHLNQLPYKHPTHQTYLATNTNYHNHTNHEQNTTTKLTKSKTKLAFSTHNYIGFNTLQSKTQHPNFTLPHQSRCMSLRDKINYS
jgi:hypothetical protein